MDLPTLPIPPDYNIRDVRTKDDALIVSGCDGQWSCYRTASPNFSHVLSPPLYLLRTYATYPQTAKVMIFYELTDLELMLDTTPDPIGDFINAVCGDVVAFCAVRGYEEFVSETDKLSKLETFPQLTMRAERSGYKISKVVFRGYHCSESLALMHSQAMESRTQLRLQSDTQQQVSSRQQLPAGNRTGNNLKILTKGGPVQIESTCPSPYCWCMDQERAHHGILLLATLNSDARS